jgi:tetratricopeptide (TPR) repeat protein
LTLTTSVAMQPLALFSLMQSEERWSATLIEQFLSRCAAGLVACSRLLDGPELSSLAQILPTYQAPLQAVMRLAPLYRPRAASLLWQVQRYQGLLAHHRGQQQARIKAMQQAVDTSLWTHDPVQQVAAWRALAGALSDTYYTRNGTSATQSATETLHAIQQASPLLSATSPLAHSALYTISAHAYAHLNEEEEAMRCLEQARAAFCEEHEPESLYLDFGAACFVMWEGSLYLALSEHRADNEYFQKADETFARIETLASPVPERLRVEALNNRALAALNMGDLDQFEQYFKLGAQGSRALGSEKRLREARANFKAAREAWPHESRIEQLVDFLL